MPKFVFSFITSRGQRREVSFNGMTADKALARMLIAPMSQAPTIGQLRSIARVANGRRTIVRKFN